MGQNPVLWVHLVASRFETRDLEDSKDCGTLMCPTLQKGVHSTVVQVTILF